MQVVSAPVNQPARFSPSFRNDECREGVRGKGPDGEVDSAMWFKLSLVPRAS